MTMLKIGFKHQLLLVVFVTTLGFAMLIALSLQSLSRQTAAAEVSDTLSNQVVILNDLKADVAVNASKSTLEAALGLEQLIASKENELKALSEAGVKGANGILESLHAWSKAEHDDADLHVEIGATAEAGVRGELQAALDHFEETMFSIFRRHHSDISRLIIEMMEKKTPESVEAVEARIAQFREQVLEGTGFFDTFSPKLKDIEDFALLLGDLLVEQTLAQEMAALSLGQLSTQTDAALQTLFVELDKAREEAKSAATKAKATALVAGIVIMAIAGALIMFISRKATGSLTTTVTTLEAIAQGDLTLRLKTSEGTQDEFDRLGAAVNNLTEQLGNLLGSVKSSSEQLQSQSSTLRNTIEQQSSSSERTEQETSSVAAAVEQISQTVIAMAGASEETNQLSYDAQAATDKGGVVITNALEALDQLSAMFNNIHDQLNALSDSSKQVDGVTDMISGLAEQTNLLALNAAIEAARAGDAGRGFSVVADEVRALAEKTVSATGNINSIVTQMQSQLKQTLSIMAQGQEQVNDSQQLGGQAISEMDQIRELFSQVSNRNQQQSVSIEEIASTTQSIAASMQAVLASISAGTEGLRSVQSFSDDVVSHGSHLLTQTQRFKC